MMNIILISDNLAKPKSLAGWHVATFLAFLLAIAVAVTIQFFNTDEVDFEPHMVETMSTAQFERSISTSQMHLDAYAKQIGELQARIMRLDAQNQRLVKLAGIKSNKKLAKKSKEIDAKPMDSLQDLGVGGPLVNPMPMTEIDLQKAISELAGAVGNRDEYMSVVEAGVLQNSVLKDMLPNSKPVMAAFRSSSYGWRVDPINGRKAFHDGLDFTAPTGTKIRAAADGIVYASSRTRAYGNLVKLHHGAGLETRYAHASKLLVKKGDRVAKGQVIALVGSTGRSTGPHLHYEIRLNGHPVDPRKYLGKK